MTEPKIKLVDVKKAFGPKKVLDGVTFEVAPAESFVIIGGSGTGKSVTLKCILGLLRADSGSILVDGEDLQDMSWHDREIQLKSSACCSREARCSIRCRSGKTSRSG